MHYTIEIKIPEEIDAPEKGDYGLGFEQGYIKGCEDTKQIILQTQAFMLMPTFGSA